MKYQLKFFWSFNVSFTAKMEEELDQIAEGENTYERCNE